MTKPDALLKLERLTIAYGGQPAVKALDLSVASGEVLALLGPSGCGKTTTMRAVAGLLAPASGRILLAGRDVTATPANRRGVGLVFQSYALFPHLSAFENVAFGLRLRKRPEAEVKATVGALLDTVGLTGFADRQPAALSGGQQQRVALARALAVKPELLLLDEPLSNLDARLRLEMRGELARLQRTFGTTMVYVTHDQAEALALATRIAVMRAGGLEQLGPPEELWSRPRTPFVARFMGFETILAEGPDGGLAPLSARVLEGAEAADPGSRVLAWRPESVVLGEGPHSGRVIAASYQGRSVETLLETAFGQLKAELSVGKARPQPGETLAFDLPRAAATVIGRP
jgi:putative spermidine/putrescine transport system ATP-binding protein